MQKFRIFLASPGDVSTERRIAREVIEQIRNELRFRDHLDIKVVAWDQPGAGVAMEAGLTPQEAIKRGLQQPKDCDLVVVILDANRYSAAQRLSKGQRVQVSIGYGMGTPQCD